MTGDVTRRSVSKKGFLVHTTWTPTFEELGWKFVPGDKPGEYKVRMIAQYPEQIARQLAGDLKLHAADMIDSTGQESANWFSILRNSTVADEAFYGAHIIKDLNNAERTIEKLSDRLDPAGSRALWDLVLTLVALAIDLHKMEVAVDETALAAQATRPMGGKIRGAQRSNPRRDNEILKAFNEKTIKAQNSTSNSAAHPSDTSIIEEIAKYHKRRKTGIGSPSGVRKAIARARALAGRTTKKSRT